jgi:hypothetical protein
VERVQTVYKKISRAFLNLTAATKLADPWPGIVDTQLLGAIHTFCGLVAKCPNSYKPIQGYRTRVSMWKSMIDNNMLSPSQWPCRA